MLAVTCAAAVGRFTNSSLCKKLLVQIMLLLLVITWRPLRSLLLPLPCTYLCTLPSPPCSVVQQLREREASIKRFQADSDKVVAELQGQLQDKDKFLESVAARAQVCVWGSW